MTEADVPAQVLPCLACGRALKGAFPGLRQPVYATMFSADGHYGSMFDPVTGGKWLSVNICDDCLTAAAAQGRVHHLTEQHVPQPEPEAVLWTAAAEES